MRAATEGNLPPVMPAGNLVEVLGREVRQGSPGELIVESSPCRQRRPPCKTNKEMSDEAADAAALTYLLTYETDLSIRAEIQNLAVLPNSPKPGRVSELLADFDHWAGGLMPGSYSSDDLLFRLVAKLPRELWDECRSTAERKARALHYEDLCVLLLELALEKESDQHLNAYRPGGGRSRGHGKGY